MNGFGGKPPVGERPGARALCPPYLNPALVDSSSHSTLACICPQVVQEH